MVIGDYPEYLVTITTEDKIIDIGLGGSCHWCTEAIFQALIGVDKVQQGWISSELPNDCFSEAIIVSFQTDKIDLPTLIEIHLHTHSCTSNHAMRDKYRSAIYYFDQSQKLQSLHSLTELQTQFVKPIITQVLPFGAFKSSPEHYQNYYKKQPERPFCKNIISPKLDILRRKYSANLHK
jgi:peptide-methionine (S)-S-oxide reductase